MNVRESESEKKRRREEGDTGNLKNATCEEFRQMSDGKGVVDLSLNTKGCWGHISNKLHVVLLTK